MGSEQGSEARPAGDDRGAESHGVVPCNAARVYEYGVECRPRESSRVLVVGCDERGAASEYDSSTLSALPCVASGEYVHIGRSSFRQLGEHFASVGWDALPPSYVRG